MAIEQTKFAAAAVPPENIVAPGIVRLWDLGSKSWITRPAVDAREIVATGSGAWQEPEPPPEPPAEDAPDADPKPKRGRKKADAETSDPPPAQ